MKSAVALRVGNKPIALIIILSAAPHIGIGAFDKVIVINKVIASVVRRVYVPADFDTIEKAFSGAKTAGKGIK